MIYGLFHLRIYSQKQRISDNIDSPLSFPAKLYGEFDVITSDLLFGNEAFYIVYLFLLSHPGTAGPCEPMQFP